MQRNFNDIMRPQKQFWVSDLHHGDKLGWFRVQIGFIFKRENSWKFVKTLNVKILLHLLSVLLQVNKWQSQTFDTNQSNESSFPIFQVAFRFVFAFWFTREATKINVVRFSRWKNLADVSIWHSKFSYCFRLHEIYFIRIVVNDDDDFDELNLMWQLTLFSHHNFYLFLYLSFVLFHSNWRLEIHQRDLHLTPYVHYASHQWQWLKNLKRWPRWLSARNVIYKWLSRIYSSAKSCRGFWLIWRVGRLSIKLKW